MAQRYAPIAAALNECGWRWPAWRLRVLYVSWHVAGPLIFPEGTR